MNKIVVIMNFFLTIQYISYKLSIHTLKNGKVIIIFPTILY